MAGVLVDELRPLHRNAGHAELRQWRHARRDHLAVVVLARSNVRIQEEQQRTDEQKQRAEANSRKAREVVDRMFTRVAQDLEHTPRTEKIRRALLDRRTLLPL